MKTTFAALAIPVAIALACVAPDAQAIKWVNLHPLPLHEWRIPEPPRPLPPLLPVPPAHGPLWPGLETPLSHDDGPTEIPLHQSTFPRVNSATPMPVVPLPDAADLAPFNPRRVDKTPAAPCPADPSSPHYLRSLVVPCASFAPPNPSQLWKP